jgi:hypothetical protein
LRLNFTNCAAQLPIMIHLRRFDAATSARGEGG